MATTKPKKYVPSKEEKEALRVLFKTKIITKPYLDRCKGYDSKFINSKVNITDDLLSPEQKQLLPEINQKKKGKLLYNNQTVWFNAERKLPFYSAYNIDGSKDQKKAFRNGIDFEVDPRVDAKYQLGRKFYALGSAKKNANNPANTRSDFQKGHMTSFDEAAWGSTTKQAQERALLTFFYTNACPQNNSLNGGLWATLEEYFQAEAASLMNQKICVFTGPILRYNDPIYKKDKSTLIPCYFYKIVVFEYKNQLRSTAFVMSQRKALATKKIVTFQPEPEKRAFVFDGNFEDFPYGDITQVDVHFVNTLTGIPFTWKNVKPVDIGDEHNTLKNIDKVLLSKDAEEIINKLGIKYE